MYAWVTKRRWCMEKKFVTRPPLHTELCSILRWNGPIPNFLSFWATERLLISKWGRISPESDWCWFKLVLGSSSLLLRGYMDLSPTVGHVRECPHSGTRYSVLLCWRSSASSFFLLNLITCCVIVCEAAWYCTVVNISCSVQHSWFTSKGGGG